MPGIVVEGSEGHGTPNELNSPAVKDNLSVNKSPRTPLSSKSPGSASLQLPCVDTSIEQLYDNVCEMESSGYGSPSRQSFGSEGDESRIDSELRHLVGGEVSAVEKMDEEDSVKNVTTAKENGSSDRKSEKMDKAQSASTKSSVSSKPSKKPSPPQLESDGSTKSTPNHKLSPERGDKSVKKPSPSSTLGKKRRNGAGGEAKLQNGSEDPSEAGLDNPDLGPFLLKHARELISVDNHRRALDYALRATKSFEKNANGKPSLDLVMSLHVLAAIYCRLGQHEQAIPVLENSIEIPLVGENQDHALAKFSGYMQLGDTYSMLGQLEKSILCYTTGLEIQKQALGSRDPRVGETCRYLAEVHLQALQFDESERLCLMALDIHRESGEEPPLEETADRRLMGLICETKGDHEAALEHLVMASMALVSNGQERDVAPVDCSIGDAYLSLGRYDEAVFAYQKALTVFKSTKGENDPTVAYVFVRLADLYNRTGKLKESKAYCENALRIYTKPLPGTPPEDIASGLADVSAIYESMNEHEQAIKLLKRALKIYEDAPGHQSTIAGIEAQMGVMYYVIGNYSESYNSFKNAITKLRACGEKKSVFFGIALNQMGLACVQRYAVNEAANLFEEAKSILEQEYGPYHPETLGVCSNLAGIYDAMGRLDDAIQILEYIVSVREEKLGTANPDVDDEKRRLAELLKEAGRVRNRKARSLDYLLDNNSHDEKKDSIAV
uniref:Nephrocystin-3 n=1 Tax=Anthurium amnicola TaxID=1678845 RepID=A0A1D1ZJR6_9ARAE